MAPLTDHLLAEDARHDLAFRPDCPGCRAARVRRSLLSGTLLSRRARALILTGALLGPAGLGPAGARAQATDEGSGDEPALTAEDFRRGGEATDLEAAGPGDEAEAPAIVEDDAEGDDAALPVGGAEPPAPAEPPPD